MAERRRQVPETGATAGAHDFTAAYWEDHYRQHEHGSHEAMPNPHLLAVVERLPVGVALDAGCGEGDEVIRLTQLGWTATGVDVSGTAIESATAKAAALGLPADFRQADLTTWTPEAEHYDLVTAHYVHTTDDRAFVRRLGSAVRPGGTLLIVGHDVLDDHEVEQHAPGSHSTAAQVSAYLDAREWDVEVAEARTRTGISADGQPSEDRDSVFWARKVVDP